METKEISKKLETLESEFKLIKGELKQTLVSVRDYLMNIKLTPPEGAAGGEPPDLDITKIIMAGAIGRGSDAPDALPPLNINLTTPAAGERAVGKAADTSPSPAGDMTTVKATDTSQSLIGDRATGKRTNVSQLPEDELMLEELYEEESEESLAPGAGLPGLSSDYEKIGGEVNHQSAPAVNLMANLVRWVANAKKELGSEQLATFLEVYGISGHLSPELKEAIQYLADTSSEQSMDASAVDIWSQLLLQLHGILTGGDAPLHPLKPFWSDDAVEAQLKEIEADEDKQEDKPLKLKLVLSNGSKDKEFTIDLDPEKDKGNP